MGFFGLKQEEPGRGTCCDRGDNDRGTVIFMLMRVRGQAEVSVGGRWEERRPEGVIEREGRWG